VSRLNDVVGAALVKALKTNTLILQLGIELNSISYGVLDTFEFFIVLFVICILFRAPILIQFGRTTALWKNFFKTIDK